MPTVTIGLVPGKAAFYCEKTRTNLTLEKPYANVVYDQADQLTHIINGLLSPTPTLVYYSGEIPEEAIKAWEDKLEAGPLKGRDFIVRDHATNIDRVVPNRNAGVRADELRAKAVPTGGAQAKAAAYVPPAEPKVEAPTEAPKEEATEAPKPAAKKTAAKKTTDAE